MKKTLLICIGLTIVVSIILMKLYSASVVSFISDIPEESDSILVPEASLDNAPIAATQAEEDEEDEISFGIDEEEYMDTLVIGSDTTIVKVNPTYLDCIVSGDQKITKNIPVRFKIVENVEVKEKFIPANTMIYAMPEINGSDINLKVSSLKTSKGLVILSLHSLKQDLNDVMLTHDETSLLQDGDTVLFDY